MNSKYIALFPAALLAGFLASAQAADFDYNYVQVEYQDRDLDGLDGDAFRFSGSVDLGDRFNLLGSYATGEVTTGPWDLDFDELSLGIGFHAPVADSTDVLATLQAVSHDQDAVGDDTGYRIGLGIRSQLADNVELTAGVDYLDIYDRDDTTFTIGSRFYLNKATSLGISYSSSSEDVETFSGGLRIDF